MLSHESIFRSKQPSGDNGADSLEPPSKRHLHSSRMLNYDNQSIENITLKQKLNEIQFP